MARQGSLTSAIGRLLAGSPLPIYAVDAERRLVYANEAFLEWLAPDADQLLGERCDYQSSPEPGVLRQRAAGLCPPPDVFLGRVMMGDVVRWDEAGRPQRFRAQFVPLSWDEGQLPGVLVLVDPREREQEATVDGDEPDWHRQLIELRKELSPRYGMDHLLGDSPPARRVRDQVRLAHQARARTVVYGPPGSGREHVARTIHYGDDPTRVGRLVPVACPLMDAELIEMTIGGLLRTLDSAAPGPPTLLLSEVDQLPADAQQQLVGLLRSADQGLGTICTAREDLVQLAAAGSFRSDLAALLSTLVIRLPPLCERPQDIPLLAQGFIERFNARGGRQVAGLSPEALDRLLLYDWPGNIDELAEVVEAACRNADGSWITPRDLPPLMHFAADAAARPNQPVPSIQLDEFLAEVELELIQRALKQAEGNKTKAAELLGITRARLHRRLEQMGQQSNDEDSA